MYVELDPTHGEEPEEESSKDDVGMIEVFTY